MSNKTFIECDYCHTQAEIKDSNESQLQAFVRVVFLGIGLTLDFCCVGHAIQALKIRGQAPIPSEPEPSKVRERIVFDESGNRSSLDTI